MNATGREPNQEGDPLACLRQQPQHAALLLDVDGTLAPIVDLPENAGVPERTRQTLSALSRSYGLIACVSGRRATDACRIVGLDSIAYAGNHGFEYLPAGATEPLISAAVSEQAEKLRRFAIAQQSSELDELGITLEDKQTIFAFHWRNARDAVAARALLERIAFDAREQGLLVHWGRMVLEIRPDVSIDKGDAVETILAQTQIDAALYAGDDTTDVDAFRKLREMLGSGRLSCVVCVGVVSDESPPEIAGEADVTVKGPTGFALMLEALRT